jgi:hypothetical protein
LHQYGCPYNHTCSKDLKKFPKFERVGSYGGLSAQKCQKVEKSAKTDAKRHYLVEITPKLKEIGVAEFIDDVENYTGSRILWPILSIHTEN